MEKLIENANAIIKSLSGFDVEIVAATKTRTIEEIKLLIENTSVKVAGENRVQELLSKYEPTLTWDFIGQLQTNKVKSVVGRVRLIHSVDRVNLLQEIDREAAKRGIIQDILIEVNTGNEESKGGLHVVEAEEFASSVATYGNVRLLGLMAVAPLTDDAAYLQGCFDSAYKAFCGLKKSYSDIKYLSMGMSNDYLQAVNSGANLIRLGRAIFGERNYGTN